MIDKKKVDELVSEFIDGLPPGLREMKQELDKTARHFLQGAFSKLDLVTREEFDAQAGVLARTREKLDALEKQLAEWEQKHKK